jgi:hypothetical protein
MDPLSDARRPGRPSVLTHGGERWQKTHYLLTPSMVKWLNDEGAKQKISAAEFLRRMLAERMGILKG